MHGNEFDLFELKINKGHLPVFDHVWHVLAKKFHNYIGAILLLYPIFGKNLIFMIQCISNLFVQPLQRYEWKANNLSTTRAVKNCSIVPKTYGNLT